MTTNFLFSLQWRTSWHLTTSHHFSLNLNVGNTSRYCLRNVDNLQTIFSRTTLYSNFFLLSTIRAWNNFPASLDTFKQFLSRKIGRVPKYFYIGNRRDQLLHTRLWTNCSNLNNDLFLKHITDSSLCLCGSIENVNHYFFVCPLYARQRTHCLTAWVFRSIITIWHWIVYCLVKPRCRTK